MAEEIKFPVPTKPDAAINGDKQWKFGHLRDANQTSKCQFLSVTAFIQIGQREVQSGIELPGMPGGKMIEQVVVGFPEAIWRCSSEEFIRWGTREIPNLTPQVLRTGIRVNLTHCQCCPYFKETSDARR